MKTAAVLAGGMLLLAAPVAGAAAAAGAVAFTFPAQSTVTGTQVSALGSYALPVGPWRNGAATVIEAEGPLRITAWRIAERNISTMQLMVSLRGQLKAAGYTPLYECAARECGGFDFRYGMKLLPEPQMHVDLGDFRYLAAQRQGQQGPEYVGLMISRSQDAGFVEAIRIGGAEPATAPRIPTPGEVTQATGAQVAGQEASRGIAPSQGTHPGTDLGTALADRGSVALEDLDFPTGSSELAPGKYASLVALAAYLAGHPDQKVTLVGHTDAVGTLAANIALSKKRAESVMKVLVGQYGADAKQLSAEGVGYLAPRATNQTKAGREANRRVEAILDSTQ